MTETNRILVTDYLARVTRATAGLPPDRQEELLRDLREHIEAGRSELPAETEAQVREILERLGDPEVIARAAAEDAGPLPSPTPAARSGRRVPLVTLLFPTLVLVLALFASALFFAQRRPGRPRK